MFIGVGAPWHTVGLGMKGMAEGGIMGASAARSNAVADALAPLGIEASRQPFTSRRLAALPGRSRAGFPGQHERGHGIGQRAMYLAPQLVSRPYSRFQ
jgi:hypothetical protein